jgi:hypothetical protein
MSGPIRALLWKEWREQRWKLAFGCVILTAYTAIGLETRLLADAAILGIGIFFVGGVLLPIFVTMGMVAPERADGSFASLVALPVRPRRVLVVKTMIGALACALPFAGQAAAGLFIAGGREMARDQLLAWTGAGAFLAVAVFVWTLAFSIRQPTEARAGLVGIGVIGVLAGVLVVCAMLRISPSAWLINAHPFLLAISVASPAEYRPSLPMAFSLPLAFMTQTALFALLLAWAAHRFGRPGRQRS